VEVAGVAGQLLPDLTGGAVADVLGGGAPAAAMLIAAGGAGVLAACRVQKLITVQGLCSSHHCLHHPQWQWVACLAQIQQYLQQGWWDRAAAVQTAAAGQVQQQQQQQQQPLAAVR